MKERRRCTMAIDYDEAINKVKKKLDEPQILNSDIVADGLQPVGKSAIDIINLGKGPINTDTGTKPVIKNLFEKPKEQTQISPAVKNNSSVRNNFTSGNLGVRDAMTALGYDNDKIGWDGKNVTYDGNYFITPDKNEEGTTKTNTGAFLSAVNDYNKRIGVNDDVVGVTSYVAGDTGLSNLVTYGQDGAVMVGGVPIKNTVIIDGKAYVRQSDANNAIKKFKQNTGYKTNSELIEEALKDTETHADYYAKKFNDFKEFEYVPEKDPAYLSYKDAYTRAAEDAYDDIYGQMAARTGGYTNSAAVTAAARAYLDHMDELGDRIPELMQSAYGRYSNDYDRIINGMNMYGTPLERAMMMSNAEEKDNNLIQLALDKNYERDNNNNLINRGNYEWDKEFGLRKDAQENAQEMDKRYYNDITLPQSEMQKTAYLADLIPKITSDTTFGRWLLSDDNSLRSFLGTYGVQLSDDELQQFKTAARGYISSAPRKTKTTTTPRTEKPTVVKTEDKTGSGAYDKYFQ